MSYIKDDNRHEDVNRNIAFQTVVGLRDALSLATKKQQPPTYEQALDILYDLNEELHDDICKLITSKNENDTVKYYKEEASLQTISEGYTISPEFLIDKEIKRLTTLKKKANLPKEEVRFIEGRIAQLYTGLENLKPRNLSENRILNRDYSKVDRSSYCGEKVFENDFYVDYTLGLNRTLRLRLLHPDTPEHVTGADLIYEQHDQESERIRFVFLQYKTWDEGVIYFAQQKNLIPQMDKMKCTLCDKGFCKKPEIEDVLEKYRFPYCCGFLRPTDKLQHSDSKMLSSGLHLPICKVLEIASVSKKLEKKDLRNNTLNHKHFEELFNLNIIGSRWLKYDEVEDFYKERKILQNDDTIKIFAREIIEK